MGTTWELLFRNADPPPLRTCIRSTGSSSLVEMLSQGVDSFSFQRTLGGGFCIPPPFTGAALGALRRLLTQGPTTGEGNTRT